MSTADRTRNSGMRKSNTRRKRPPGAGQGRIRRARSIHGRLLASDEGKAFDRLSPPSRVLPFARKIFFLLTRLRISCSIIYVAQEWRNWQTRRLQVPVAAMSCGFKSHLLHFVICLSDDMRKCRNWQTSKTKDLVAAMSCGFKSHLPHFIRVPGLSLGLFSLSK